MALTYLFGYPDFIVMLSQSIQVETHSHHAIQITCGLEDPLIIQYSDQRLTGRCVYIQSDTTHLLDSQGGATINYLIHPESTPGKKLQNLFTELPVHIQDKHITLPETTWSVLSCEEIYKTSTQTWPVLHSVNLSNEQIDPRIQTALQHIHSLETLKTSVDSLAEKVYLSPSRFMALFRQETGIPLRRYLLWHRLLRASIQIMEGSSFTIAAHDTGFSDAAHLSRTFKQMFGITLQAVFTTGDFIQAVFCMQDGKFL